MSTTKVDNHRMEVTSADCSAAFIRAALGIGQRACFILDVRGRIVVILAATIPFVLQQELTSHVVIDSTLGLTVLCYFAKSCLNVGARKREMRICRQWNQNEQSVWSRARFVQCVRMIKLYAQHPVNFDEVPFAIEWILCNRSG